jgi:hypothetical protein
MAKPASVGQFEQMVLTAIVAFGDKAYGVTIHAKVEDSRVRGVRRWARSTPRSTGSKTSN